MNLKPQDEYLNEIFKKVAEKHGVDEKYPREMYDHFFYSLRKVIQSHIPATIEIAKFGTFEPNLKKVNAIIRKTLLRYNEGYIPRDDAARVISQVWPVRQALIIDKLYKKKNDKRYGSKRRKRSSS